MDPVTLVLTALVAGASAGLSGTATQAISEAYTGLKQLLRRRFAGRGQDPGMLEVEETEPEAWRTRLDGRLSQLMLTTRYALRPSSC